MQTPHPEKKTEVKSESGFFNLACFHFSCSILEKTKTQYDVQSAVGISHLVNESMVMETDNRELSMKVHLPKYQAKRPK